MSIDERLPFLLQKKHIAYSDTNALYILDRRLYPTYKSYFRCQTVTQIAQALQQMVTQGGGPLQVGLETMRFIATKIHHKEKKNHLTTFIEAAHQLSQARPTNTTLLRTLFEITDKISRWYLCGEIRDSYQDDLPTFVEEIISSYESYFDDVYDKLSDYGSSLIQDGMSILTTCFAEHSFSLAMAKAVEQGKSIEVFVNETRPYLQGSRLSAPSLAELGVRVNVIVDGSAAALMANNLIHLYMTAVDVVAMDGSMANKTGTLPNAIAASYYGIKYYPFAMSPDPNLLTIDHIVIEKRDGSELTTTANVKGYYPAFDVVPPSLVSGYITKNGIVAPEAIAKQFGEPT